MLQAKAYAQAEKERLVAERQADTIRSRNTLIFALAKLAESRDTDTGEHLERIAAYSRVLGEQLRVSLPELTDQWILNLQLASSLHDIGKVGIPDAILRRHIACPECLVAIPMMGASGVCALLSAERVNILALELDATGRLRLVVDNPVHASGILREHHHQVSERDVLLLTVPNAPGAVAPALRLVSDAGINVEYAYGSITDGGSTASIILGVDDAQRASSAAGI
jgi:hypothetical protein